MRDIFIFINYTIIDYSPRPPLLLTYGAGPAGGGFEGEMKGESQVCCGCCLCVGGGGKVFSKHVPLKQGVAGRGREGDKVNISKGG